MSVVLVPLASGFEEIEAVAIIDVVRRAGIKVLIASVDTDAQICGAHGITIASDIHIKDIDTDMIDLIALPGGWGGTKILAEDARVQTILKEMNNKGKQIAAICAAPFALDKAGVLKDSYTCYPSIEQKIENKGYRSATKVVLDQNILTSKGPGTAICFGLEIVKLLAGEALSLRLKDELLADFC